MSIKILTLNNKPVLSKSAGNKPIRFFSPPNAEGGTITYDGDYKIHTFDNQNDIEQFKVISGIPIDASILVVGAGAPGRQRASSSNTVSGGGGAGCVIQDNIKFNTKKSYDINIGKSQSALDYYYDGREYTTTTFGDIYAAEGGYIGSATTGKGGDSCSGYSGGSGGNPTDDDGAGGGGGGHTTNGQSVSGYGKGGDGGAGIKSSISGTELGYGGGGGGASDVSFRNGGSGKDGGGHGADRNKIATAGVRGGGGGGNLVPGSNQLGNDHGHGGKGIVIIRYKYK